MSGSDLDVGIPDALSLHASRVDSLEYHRMPQEPFAPAPHSLALAALASAMLPHVDLAIRRMAALKFPRDLLFEWARWLYQTPVNRNRIIKSNMVIKLVF